MLRDTNLHVVFLITLTSILGVSSIAPVLGVVMVSFGVSGSEVSWVMTCFTLPGIFLTPVLGVLADRFGRRRVLIPSLFLFAIAGAGCFFAESFTALLAFRTLQGIGAAALMVLNLTLIGDLYSGRARTEAMGLNEVALSFGTALFPLLGGALGLLGWRYPFLLSLAALPVIFRVWFRLKSPRPDSREDWGSYTRNLAVVLRSGRSIYYLFLMMTLFLLVYAVCVTLFPLFLETKYRFSSFLIGVYLATMSAGTALGAWKLKQLEAVLGRKKILATAFFLYASAAMLVPVTPAALLLLAPAFVFGLANGMGIPALQTILSEIAPLAYRGAMMSFSGIAVRVGQTAGPGLVGVLLAAGTAGTAFFAIAFFAASLFLFIAASPRIWRNR